jgi:acyl-CoA synthetase (AMP-forming)/AMP-acid ligase II
MKELVYHRLFLPGLDAFGSTPDAIVDGAYRSDFATHGDRVLRLASALRSELGVNPGDRVAVMSTNNHQYLELYHACFLGAAVVNPLNLRLAGKELDHIIRDSGTEVVFVDSFFAGAFAAAMEQSDAGPSPIRHVVLMGDVLDPDNPPPHDVDYEDLIAAGEPVVPEEPEEHDPVVLMYTGGTTGLPKGVLLEQRAEMLNMYHVLSQVQMKPDQVFLHQTPMFHAASMGAILGINVFGARSVFIPLFDPGKALDLIEEHGVTWTVMVPTMIGMLLGHPEFEPKRMASLSQLTYGASPMPSAILDRLIGLYPDLDISQGYGMTECSAVLTFLGPDDHRQGGDILRSAGRPVPGVVLSIQDAEGTPVPKGETGEVCARAGNFMREYWNRPDATEEVFRDGWYHTGDAGYVDDNGYLFLVDRVKDMIVTGGENVYSAEVESVISKHAAVAQVAVIGIPHETWGEQVHAIVVLNEGAEATEDEIRDFTKDSIAGYKVPKSVEFRDEPLPLSGAMKVLKKDLRAPYWDGQERAVN